MLEDGIDATIAEIAAAEKINELCRARFAADVIAPDIVEAILDGRQPAVMSLAVLMKPFAVEWTEQRKTNFRWKNDRL